MTANQINYQHFKRQDENAGREIDEKIRHNRVTEEDADRDRYAKIYGDSVKAFSKLGSSALSLL